MRKQRRRSAALQIVQSLYFINPKFQASSVAVEPGLCRGLVGNPADRFSHNEAQMPSNTLSNRAYWRRIITVELLEKRDLSIEIHIVS